MNPQATKTTCTCVIGCLGSSGTVTSTIKDCSAHGPVKKP